VEFAGPGTQFPVAFTLDGARLIVLENFKDASVLNLVHPDHLEPLLHGEFAVWIEAVSPDGKWIAYESNESGNRVEIYLRPFRLSRRGDPECLKNCFASSRARSPKQTAM
jgi:hypothetical protein